VSALAAVLLVLGTLFMLLAAVGLLRLPDVYLRMSAASKAATLGVSLVLLGAAVHFGSLAVVGRVLAIVTFLFLTAPVAAQVIGRAAHRRGSPLWQGTTVDELAGSEGGRDRGTPPQPG
jgi:multicomponent Na+:H+ antiporter subunit G